MSKSSKGKKVPPVEGLEDLENRVWCRKLKGSENCLYLIAVDKAPQHLQDEFRAEQERNKVRTQKRKKTLTK